MSETNEQQSHAVAIEQFEGPFHVLVELLQKQKLDIVEVNLAEVTEQYIETVNTQESIDPYALADFLVVASKLLYLKSKTLLPMLAWDHEEDEEMEDLEEQLKMYKSYYDASQVMEAMLKKNNVMVSREKLAVDVEVLFNPPHDLTGHTMSDVLKTIVQRLEPIVKIPQKIVKRTVTIKERMKHVREHILQKVQTNFSELLKGAKTKSDSVVTFLAVLELVKQRIVHVDQQELHGEIEIKKHSI